MKFTSLSLVFVLFSIFVQHSQVLNSQELSAIDIIQMADEKVRGKTNHSILEMLLELYVLMILNVQLMFVLMVHVLIWINMWQTGSISFNPLI